MVSSLAYIHNASSCSTPENIILISQVKVINETNLLNVLSIIFRVGNLLFMCTTSAPSGAHLKRFLLIFYLLVPRRNEIKIFDPDEGER